MCQTGTCRRFKHATKDYLTFLISETLQIWWRDIGYYSSFVKNHAKLRIFWKQKDKISQIITV
jgi:hypothetical protein